MKSNILTLVFSLIALNISLAQDLSGIWKGNLKQGAAKFNFELDLQKIDSIHYNCTTTIEVGGEYGVMNAECYFKDEELYFKENKIIANKSSDNEWCLKTAKLSYKKRKRKSSLVGSWTGECDPGTIELFKVKKSRKNNKSKAPKKNVQDNSTISEITKKSRLFKGLFDIYQDSLTGGIKMVIKEEQIGKEYIYFNQVTDGISDVGLLRGFYRGSKVFKIEKYFNKIQLIFQNTSSYFDPENAISKSSGANLSEGIIASLEIENSQADKGLYLIDANNLFFNETFSQIKPPNRPNQHPYAFSLGNLNMNKSKINQIRNYPQNTDLAIEYVYSKSNIFNKGSRSVADGRNVSIKVYHSLIEMPDNDFEPLIDDPRIGFFTTKVSDMTNNELLNYKDLVHRWNLKKKYPDLPISEPVKPIIWWIENTTPVELRPIIKRAGELWNLAFEEAGFKNAVVLKQQPDSAAWDAGDIRYNVLRWTSSPYPFFSGYGPSFVNPRTGEILGADIMLEYRSLSYLGDFLKLIGNGGAFNENELSLQQEGFENKNCQATQYGKMENVFGNLTVEILDSSKTEKKIITEQFLTYLILHEMGHTFGLSHNMKSSQLHSIKEIHNKELTSKIGLTGSVMDYPAINVALDRTKQGLYWTLRPGPYDIWAIKFAYQDGRSEQETKNLLNESTKHELVFGNDADDMRYAGKAMDPKINVNDMSSDAIAYSIERLELTKVIGENLLERLKEEGNSYHKHRVSYRILLSMQRSHTNTISRYIGGVYTNRALIGQEGATKPFIPVSLEKQKEAMNALNQYVFSSDAFIFPNEIYNYLQFQRRGFGFYRLPEDPKIHESVLDCQKSVLNHLLHKNTLQRIVDSELYGNTYKLSDVMSDLTNSIFKSDIYSNVNSFRQNLQIEYTRMLIDLISNDIKNIHLHTVKSNAIYNLKRIKKMASNTSGNVSTKAHKAHLILLINNALKEIK